MGPPLTPVSGHDGKVVATNILEGNRHKPDYRGVPSVAFTLPPIASVGLKESQAQQQGLRFKVKSENTPNWYTARRLAERVYGYKTAACPSIVKGSLEAIPGVAKVAVSFKDKTARVIYDDAKANVNHLTSATTKAGYPSAPKS